MQNDCAEITDYRHYDTQRLVMSFARDAASDAGHGSEKRMLKRRQHPSKKSEKEQTTRSSFDKLSAVIEHILDGRESERDDACIYDSVKYIVELASQEYHEQDD